jgi:hypothetical protein
MLKNRLNLFTRSHHRNIEFALCPDHPFHFPTFLIQHMSLKKSPRIECSVLGCGRHLSVHRQRRQELPDIRRRERWRILASSTCLKVSHPLGIGFQGCRSIVPDLDVIGQAGVDGSPGNSRCSVGCVGGRDGLRRQWIGSLPRRAGFWGGACVTGY